MDKDIHCRCPQCGAAMQATSLECGCGCSVSVEERTRFLIANLASSRGLSPGQADDLLESVQEMRGMLTGALRPVPHAITMDWLNATPDEGLGSLYDYVLHLLDSYDSTRAEQVLGGLSRGLQFVYELTVLDGEVVNGGFGQYLGNGIGSVPQALQALRQIGAADYAALLTRALAIDACDGRDGNHSETLCGDLLDEHLKLNAGPRNLWVLLYAWIRAHPHEVLHPSPPKRFREP